ncbi:MAG: hypothetical protein HY897_12145 [Deltaproteobacteria bacterium]|nr:hypothetical protein [Deltaproteobacteria bacterium]
MNAQERTGLLRTAGTALVGLCIVSAGLLLGGVRHDLEAVADGDPGAHYFSHEMPRMPGAREAPLGAGLSFNNMPLEVSFFQTEKPVAEVREFYLAKFAAMKLSTSVTDGGDEGAVVYGNDTQKKVQRIISIQRRGGATFVFPAQVPLLAVPSFAPPENLDVALMPGASGFVQIGSSDYGRPSRLIMWHHEKETQAVAAFVKDEMKRLGWAEAEGGGPSLMGTVLEFSRPGGSATFTVFRQKTEGPTSVVANVQGRAAFDSRPTTGER